MRVMIVAFVGSLSAVFAVPAWAEPPPPPPQGPVVVAPPYPGMGASPYGPAYGPPYGPVMVAVPLRDPCCLPCPRTHLTIGAWLWDVDGRVGGLGGIFDVDSDWGDVFDEGDLALDLGVRTEWSRWRFAGAMTGGTLSDGAVDFEQGGMRRSGDLEVWTGTLTAGYVFAGGWTDCSPCPGRWCLDAYVGLRYWDVHLEIDPIFGAGGATGLRRGEDWLDPIVGLHLDVEHRRWFFVAEVDVGGFGLGSDFSWSALGAAGFRFAPWFGVMLGWKALSADYDDDGFVFDATLNGPFASLVFTF
jgi:hypothetical protein